MVVSTSVVYCGYGCYLCSPYDPFPGTGLDLRTVFQTYHHESNALHLHLPTLEQITTRVEVCSQAKPVGQSKRGATEMSTRQSHVYALKVAGLLDSNDGTRI
jgi:hypothetical protein